MYGFEFTVYVPAAAAGLRAVWVKHSTPTRGLDGSVAANADLPIEPAPVILAATGADASDPGGNEPMRAEIDRVAVSASLDDPGEDGESLPVSR